MADENINIVITATDKASQTIAAVSKSLQIVSGAVKDVTKSYIAYGDQVGTLSRFIGTNNEETSRLIQLADDAFVSFETLRMAAKNLSEKGVQPSTENLAKLSDEFLAMQPGLERSQFLIDKFGRAGIEMSKIMELGGDKIREMSASISDSLIIDDAKAAKILASKQALDNFNDAIEGVKYDAAATLLGIFQGMPKPLQDATLGLGAFLSPENLNALANMSILLNNISKLGALSKLGGWFMSAASGLTAMGSAAIAAMGPLIALLAVLLKIIDALAKMPGNYGPGASMGVNNVPLEGKAEGGPVARGMPYIVGEKQPELFIPRENGVIMPSMKGAGGGQTIIVNYSPVVGLADRHEAETKLAPYILAALRSAA